MSCFSRAPNLKLCAYLVCLTLEVFSVISIYRVTVFLTQNYRPALSPRIVVWLFWIFYVSTRPNFIAYLNSTDPEAAAPLTFVIGVTIGILLIGTFIILVSLQVMDPICLDNFIQYENIQIEPVRTPFILEKDMRDLTKSQCQWQPIDYVPLPGLVGK